ncbi:MAG: alpha/beta hydrolase family protein [Planctomycetota bacterium]
MAAKPAGAQLTAARREHQAFIDAELASGTAAARVAELLVSRGVPADIASAIVERAVAQREVDLLLPQYAEWIAGRLRHRTDEQAAAELAREYDIAPAIAARLVTLQRRAATSAAIERSNAGLDSPWIAWAGLPFFVLGVGTAWHSYLQAIEHGGYYHVATGAVVLGATLTILALSRHLGRPGASRGLIAGGILAVGLIALATLGIAFGLITPVAQHDPALDRFNNLRNAWLSPMQDIDDADEGPRRPSLPPTEDYSRARDAFRTTLRREAPAPGTPAALGAPPAGAALVSYPAPIEGQRFGAWISDNAVQRGARHPGVVFVHRGTELTADDWTDVSRAFVSRGFALFAPTFRGEHGNAGSFEMGFGEVDDLRAAARWFALQEGVDGQHIFVFGSGTGGTMALLAVLRSSVFLAGGAYDAPLDMARAWSNDDTPHNFGAGEDPMRDARTFGPSMQVPFSAWLRPDDTVRRGSLGSEWATFADTTHQPCTVVPLARHDDSLAAAARDCAEWFTAGGH